MLHAFHVPFEGLITPGVSRGALTQLREHCRQTAMSDVAKLQATLGDLGVQWRTAVERGDARAAILAGAVRHRADLLARGTHGRSGIAHVLIGRVLARPARVSFELP